MTEPVPRTQLMIVLEVGAGAAERLAAALAAATIASVILAPAADGTLDAASTRPLVTAIQKAGAAALIESDAALARALRADGVHLPVSEAPVDAYAQARETLGSRAAVGLDAGRSRHDAMTAGEDGADYVGFGIPDFVQDRATAAGRRAELIGWWAEIFEVPCVAFDVADAAEARALAAAGAEFIALRLAVGATPAAAAKTVREVREAIAESKVRT